MYDVATSIKRLSMLQLFFASFCLFICSTPLLAASAPCKTNNCIAIIDAGSTGSRLHIYTYDKNSNNTLGTIKELWNKKITPGIATIDSSPATIDSYLNNLLADAPIKELPLYFYATGGMRLLSHNKQQEYYKELKHWFNAQNEWSLNNAKTITGDEEGLYDWLAVNYRLGTFNQEKKEAIGVMDMGGASVQIVFPVRQSELLSTENTTHITINNQEYNLYIHSFLGLGQTEIARPFINTNPCFSEHYPLPNGSEGEGDAYACAQQVASLINQNNKVSTLIQPLLAANPVDSWYSIGGIAYLADNSLFHFSNAQFSNQELLQQANNQICHQQWDILSQQFPNDASLAKYCFFSAYYYALMVDGYGLHSEQVIHYIPPKDNVDWTSGVALDYFAD